jgi:sulfhydrogenase subunit beta (sulfur reductase)
MAKAPKEKLGLKHVVEREDFQTLLDTLAGRGYRLVGPTLRSGAVVYDEIRSVSDFPIGYTDNQEKGTYQIQPSSEQRLFGYGLGPQSWKKYLFPPAVRLWQAHQQDGSFDIQPEAPAPDRLALIGVRACELHAIAIQDRVFMGGAYIDPIYRAQRENIFILAVNCGRAGKTCFCASMNTGPKATSGFDLALTEVLEPDRHYFVVETGSRAGAEILHEVPHQPASDEEIQSADGIIAQAAAQMTRFINTSGLKELLYASYDHPQWETVAARCLTCGNCTLVCPTCFCSTIEDATDLAGDTAERWRRWDSCFTMDFSYIVGGSVRASAKSRYRQWMTHKLASWIDQFGTSGCVGCGRCITWCPVGIDITEEARIIRADEMVNPDSAGTRKKKYENA